MFAYFLSIDTNVDLENVSLPICTWQHLCETSGCSNDHKVPRFCHCDGACTFYDDCCIDYKDVCSSDGDEFEEILASRNIRKADMECVTLDSGGYDFYWMVSRCDRDLDIVKERCENPFCTDTLSSIPVTDMAGITYRNVYCAVCHNIETSNLTAWSAVLDCEEIIDDALREYSSEDEIALIICMYCSFSFAPPISSASHVSEVRKCQPSDYSDEIEHGCEHYTALVDFEGEIYKNPHCLFPSTQEIDFNITCGGGVTPRYFSPSFGGDLPETEIPAPGVGTGVPLSIVLDFGSRGKSSSLKVLTNSEVITEKIVNCPEGEVFVERTSGTGSCVPVSCPDGLKLQNGDCIPDTSSKCDMNSGNRTIILKARLLKTSGFCGDGMFRNASIGLLTRLLGESLLSEFEITQESVVCNEDFEQGTVNVSYTIISTADAYEIIQDHLESNIISNSPSMTLNDIDELEIATSCLNHELEYMCDSDWIPDNEYTLISTNTSYSVFLNKTGEWIMADEIISRVRYERENMDSGFVKYFEVNICHIANYLSCPFLTLNISLFEIMNSTGEAQYLPNGHILKQTEYMVTADDQILVCNFFNQSASINVTEIVTFFEYSGAQTIISIIGGMLSLIAIILTLTTYAVFANLRNRASRLIMNLVTALFLGQFLLMFGGNQTQNPVACSSIAVIAHYAWLAAFAWMNTLAFDLDRTFGNPDNLQKVSEGKKSLFRYMAYAWGSPLLIVIPCIAVHFCQCTKIYFQYGSGSACWISDGTANLLTFGAPAAVFLLCNGVLFGHTVVGIRSAKKATARIHKDKTKLKRTAQELLIYIKVSVSTDFS